MLFAATWLGKCRRSRSGMPTDSQRDFWGVAVRQRPSAEVFNPQPSYIPGPVSWLQQQIGLALPDVSLSVSAVFLLLSTQGNHERHQSCNLVKDSSETKPKRAAPAGCSEDGNPILCPYPFHPKPTESLGARAGLPR